MIVEISAVANAREVMVDLITVILKDGSSVDLKWKNFCITRGFQGRFSIKGEITDTENFCLKNRTCELRNAIGVKLHIVSESYVKEIGVFVERIAVRKNGKEFAIPEDALKNLTVVRN